ncbi:MAG: LLM class flavin-dependent oxidoreductase [Planctomycetes bacterium]|nr:LLM class flavin-dependent oxidoreductase [Planctomycetota bacterium]MCP4772575.1 LLM class flavin-dependent oxidoreductase [Planctomycetota bacterium]MCP4860885.1 LLM class flavin-dependent oxidoreductase [Planctomycetota bacterium]
MDFDVFFSICQTPVGGSVPNEATMFRNFFEQVQLADELGYGCAWVAESHLSTEVQKSNRRPVVPHFQGEVGLNVDFCQLSHKVFACTKRIETGAAVMNIICNGGPIAAAERIASFCALHGLDPEEKRRIHIGFAAGRFEFMNRAYGVDHRDAVEEAAWPAYKGQMFREACHIFLKLLRGDVLDSTQTPEIALERSNFRSDEDWQRVQEAWVSLNGGETPQRVPFAKRWAFEQIKIVPQEWRRELLQLVVGSHDPVLQKDLNEIQPVQVFNLSITSDEIINQTHERMAKAYHADGGAWQRSYMPRTVMVFLNAEEGLSPEQQSAAAHEEAKAALSEYWNALEGTIDPHKVAGATENALVGNAQEIALQVAERFHADDRLMLWFDFYNHDNERVKRNMEAFYKQVIPSFQGASA